MINLGAGPAFFAGFPDAFTRLVDLQASRDAPMSTSYLFVELWGYRFSLCVHSTCVGSDPQLRPSYCVCVATSFPTSIFSVLPRDTD